MTDLVADIGGTNARVAFRDTHEMGPPLLRHTADFPSLNALLGDVIAAAGVKLTRAALAVAGPVTGDIVTLTNLPWTFSARALAAELGVADVLVENDVAAIALSIPNAGTHDLKTIRAGTTASDAPRLVIAPGTGLGMAALTNAGGRWTALPSEGGHAYAGAPPSIDPAMAARIWRQPVTWEDLLSGQGLLRLYHHASDDARAAMPADVTALASHGDAAALAAIALYSELLGACASDMAMIFGARGGCYIAGGVVPALGDLFRADAFEAGFSSKDAFAHYVKPIPVFAMTDPYAALRGLCHLMDE